MEAIASRAAVSKETLYRWWRSKTDILLEALAQLGEDVITVSDTGSLAADLRSFMRATARALDPPTRRLLRTLAAAAAADPKAADEVREQFLVHRRTALTRLLARAVDRAELTEERAAITLDLVYGSLWYRLIFGIGPLDSAWADAVTDLLETLCGHQDAVLQRSALEFE
jgi:AcrR family transcriptional regulator